MEKVEIELSEEELGKLNECAQAYGCPKVEQYVKQIVLENINW